MNLIEPPEGIRLTQLSAEKIKYLWNKLKVYDKVFEKGRIGDFDAFRNMLCREDTLVLEMDGGLVILDNIIDGLRASCHAYFWENKIHALRPLMKDLILYGFFQFDLKRMECRVPFYARSVMRFLEKLGFKQEGRLRNAWEGKDGVLIDVLVYGILKEEVL